MRTKHKHNFTRGRQPKEREDLSDRTKGPGTSKHQPSSPVKRNQTKTSTERLGRGARIMNETTVHKSKAQRGLYYHSYVCVRN
jgi:hypothetical protein